MEDAVELWAKQVINQIKLDEEKHSQEKAVLIEEQSIRRDQAPRIWSELRLQLKERCERLNIESGKQLVVFEVTPHKNARIGRIDKPGYLQVEFSDDSFRIYYKCGSGNGEFLFKVNSDTTVTLETVYHIPYTISQVCEQLFEMLFKSEF